MRAIKINEKNMPKIIAVIGEDDARVMQEYMDEYDRYFIKELTDRQSGAVTNHWATVPEDSLLRYFDVAVGNPDEDWVRVSRKEFGKYFALEIKTEWAFRLAQAIQPKFYTSTYEEAKGKFLVMDYPAEGHFEIIDPAYWEENDFVSIENGPVIRLKKFLTTGDI